MLTETDEVSRLAAQVESLRAEIRVLRHQLGSAEALTNAYRNKYHAVCFRKSDLWGAIEKIREAVEEVSK